MISITDKTLQDLEFNTVLQAISEICNTDLGKEKALKITPFKNKEERISFLNKISSDRNNVRERILSIIGLA